MAECIFCKIASKKLNTEFLYEDKRIVAFKDINPVAPVHVIIIPKKHYDSIKEVNDKDLIGDLFLVGNKVAKKLEINSYRFVINTEKEAGQTVFHLHLHLIGGREMNWPPG